MFYLIGKESNIRRFKDENDIPGFRFNEVNSYDKTEMLYESKNFEKAIMIVDCDAELFTVQLWEKPDDMCVFYDIVKEETFDSYEEALCVYESLKDN